MMNNINYFQFSSYYFILPAIFIVVLIVLFEKKPLFKKLIPDFLNTGISFYAILTFVFGLTTSIVHFVVRQYSIINLIKIPLFDYLIRFFFVSGWIFTAIFWLAAASHIKRYKLKGSLISAIGFIPSLFLIFSSNNILANLVILLLIIAFYFFFWTRLFFKN